MELIAEPEAWRELLEKERRASRSVGLVLTMGALHEGHVSLIEASAASTDFTAVTVFVNPLQFGDPADLAGYPQTIESDSRLAARAGASALFTPSREAIYPDGGFARVELSKLSDVLEGASRRGHFAGVATVVTKLFSLSGPCTAFFGEKDFQQLVIVRRLVADLLLAVEVVGCPTVRAPDGLALSSRNARLTEGGRLAATVLHRALLAGRGRIEAGAGPKEASLEMRAVIDSEPIASCHYAVALQESLEPPTADTERFRLLVAATIEGVRLIDNLPAEPA